MLDDLIALLKEASTSAVDEAMVTRGSKWIVALKKEFPGAHAVIMALLYETPERVMSTLAIMNKELKPYATNEYALAYIGALQAKLRGSKNANL